MKALAVIVLAVAMLSAAFGNGVASLGHDDTAGRTGNGTLQVISIY
jgi:hypothetical protein